MIQNIPTNVINYIDSKGKLITNQVINNIQIRTEDDLSLLANCSVGTRVYLPDESKKWVYGADAQWHEVVTSGGGGSSDGGLVVHYSSDNNQLDKTWQEIYDAFASGKNCVIVEDFNAEYSYVKAISKVSPHGGSGTYPFELNTAQGSEYSTDSADGYPEWRMS